MPEAFPRIGLHVSYLKSRCALIPGAFQNCNLAVILTQRFHVTSRHIRFTLLAVGHPCVQWNKL